MTPRHRRLGVLVGIALLFPVMTAPGHRPIHREQRAEAAGIQEQMERQGEKVSVLAEKLQPGPAEGGRGRGLHLPRPRPRSPGPTERLKQTRGRLATAAVLAYVHGGSNALIGRLARGSQDRHDRPHAVPAGHRRRPAPDHRRGPSRPSRTSSPRNPVSKTTGRRRQRPPTPPHRPTRPPGRGGRPAGGPGPGNGELGELVAAEQARKEAEESAIGWRRPR